MSNRLLVVFLPVNTDKNPNPQLHLIVRGNFKDFAALKESYAESQPNKLSHPAGSGHVFIGREKDPWMNNLVRSSLHAKYWQGTMKSGSFEDFLKLHLASFLPRMAEAAVPAYTSRLFFNQKPPAWVVFYVLMFTLNVSSVG